MANVFRAVLYPGDGGAPHARGTAFRLMPTAEHAAAHAKKLARALDMWPPMFSWWVESGPLVGRPQPAYRPSAAVRVDVLGDLPSVIGFER